MSDLISRKEAIDALCDNCENMQAVCAHYPCKQYIAIEKLPSAQPELKWVPVSEGPPKEEGEVLVTTSWNDVCKAWYNNGKWRAEFTNEYDDDEILAWMSLPKPYRKDDN